jgi:hypothetical protein
MDIALLTAFLAPFLPALTQLGEKAAGKMAEKFGEDAWTKAKALWARLSPQVEAKEAAREAVIDLANAPENEDLQTALRVQLKKLLDQNQALAVEVAQLFQAPGPRGTPATQIIQNVTGDRNQVIGQVSGGQVFGNITGTVILGGGAGVTVPPAPAPDPAAKQPPAAVKTILVLAANPQGTHPLRLGEEVRKIQAGLARSQHRDRFRLEQRWAVTPSDVRRALLDCHPQIVHFSGHGVGTEVAGDPSPATRKLTGVSNPSSEPEGLVFEDDLGQPQLVTTAALADLFALFADQVECVVLNACYSAPQAEAIAQQIAYVVGMKRAIGDQAAIEFAIGFYDALLAGRDTEFAYKLGCNAIQLEGLGEELTPVLKRKLG